LEAGVSVDVLEGGAVGASLQLGRAVWMGIENILNDTPDSQGTITDIVHFECVDLQTLDAAIRASDGIEWIEGIQDLYDSHPDCAAKLQAGADGPALEHVYTKSGLQLTFPPRVSPTPSVASATPHALSLASAPGVCSWWLAEPRREKAHVA